MIARRIFLSLILCGLACLAWGYGEAVSDPVVRRAELTLAGWPKGERPLRLLLMSDIHVGGPDMPPSRLERIVGQANGLRPDLVLIAGDFLSDKRVATRDYPVAEAVAPLARLKPRLATVAVLGNHDHWLDARAIAAALARVGVVLLDNDAAVFGPLALGGLDDAFTYHDNLPKTLARMRSLGGARILLSHSPDPFAKLPGEISLMLAGHTHCGQIAPPLIGPIATESEFGRRYACGIVKEGGKTLIVTAGLGTSVLPFRIGARPEMWLLELKGAVQS